MPDTTEEVLLQTDGLQRFDKAVPPIFIFGSYLGSLVLTTQRLLFLSAGSSGADRVLAGSLLGILTPDSLRTVTATLQNPGSLAVPHEKLISSSGNRRWDFGRYLRVEYRADDGSERATSFIFRGPVLDARWIDRWEQRVAPYIARR